MTYKKFKENIPVLVFSFGLLGSLLTAASWYIDGKVDKRIEKVEFKLNQVITRLESIIAHDPKLKTIYSQAIPLIAPTGSDELPIPLSPPPPEKPK